MSNRDAQVPLQCTHMLIRQKKTESNYRYNNPREQQPHQWSKEWTCHIFHELGPVAREPFGRSVARRPAGSLSMDPGFFPGFPPLLRACGPRELWHSTAIGLLSYPEHNTQPTWDEQQWQVCVCVCCLSVCCCLCIIMSQTLEFKEGVLMTD